MIHDCLVLVVMKCTFAVGLNYLVLLFFVLEESDDRVSGLIGSVHIGDYI